MLSSWLVFKWLKKKHCVHTQGHTLRKNEHESQTRKGEQKRWKQRKSRFVCFSFQLFLLSIYVCTAVWVSFTVTHSLCFCLCRKPSICWSYIFWFSRQLKTVVILSVIVDHCWLFNCLSPFLEMSLASSWLRLARVSGSVSAGCCLRVRLVEQMTRWCPLKLVSSCEGRGLSSVPGEEERGRPKQEAESAARITHMHTPLFILQMWKRGGTERETSMLKEILVIRLFNSYLAAKQFYAFSF